MKRTDSSRIRLPRRSFAPLSPAEGPWLIRSHYWNSWHRKSSDGGACGYTDDIASAGLFGEAKAREYHGTAKCERDEAIPLARVASALRERLAEMDAERAALAEQIAALGLAGAPQ